MGLIGVVGRRRGRARLAAGVLYTLLTLGAITTLYPFLVMVTTGFKGPTDQNDNRLIPAYWQSEGELYKKYVDDKYAGDLAAIAATRGGPTDSGTVEKYRQFLLWLPLDYFSAAFRQQPSGLGGRLNTRYRDWLRKRYGSIEAVNRAYIEEDTSFESVLPPLENFARVGWKPAAGRKWDDWLVFKAQLPAEFRSPVTARAMYQAYVRAKYRFSFGDVPLSVRVGASGFDSLEVPAGGPMLEEFRAKGLPVRYRSQTVETLWAGARGRGLGASGGDGERGTGDGGRGSGSGGIPSRAPQLGTPEAPNPYPPREGGSAEEAFPNATRWRVSPRTGGEGGPARTEERRYANAEGLTRRDAGATLPIEAFERATVHDNAGAIRREFTSRNYAYVLDYLTLNGHALWTTIVFCGLAIVATLGVNGLAAYALSRYPIRASGKILVFLLATMAFPTEVTMIPNFLLLKNLHLLNTYAALVLPAAASGYMIFMLKGFFDSLPPELFEAASLDGAPEMTMLRRIALPLSKPVFGYFALVTFVATYGTFLYAFLVAQDRRMWTVMVFLYQLSGSAPKYVMMAAFTIAAMPTLLVFLLAQRMIMRGIVLPSER